MNAAAQKRIRRTIDDLTEYRNALQRELNNQTNAIKGEDASRDVLDCFANIPDPLMGTAPNMWHAVKGAGGGC